ncbi:MAG: thioredoxin-like protein [Benniella sp.]|nr:MAG: thioredoxin-like protein [Benniella sp.]
MSVGTVVPFVDDFLVISGDSSTTVGGPIPEGRTKVVVLEFWATWCGPCLQSIPHLSELQRKYKDVDVTIIGSTNEKDEQKIRQFVQEKSMNYTVVIDKNGSLHSKVFKPSGSQGIPFAAVIVNNKIVFSGHPMDPAFARTLEEAASEASSTRKEPVALPLITQTYDELMQLRPKELRQILEDRGIKSVGLSEKSEFAKLIIDSCTTTQYYKEVKPHTNAPPPPSEREEVKLPPVQHSRDELMHMHAKELIQILDDRHIDHTGMIEKPELVDHIMAKCTR